MANVWIQDNGVFSLPDGKVQDLLQWLRTEGGVNIEGANPGTVTEGDKTLLNEQGANPPHKQSGNRPASLTDEGNPIDPDKTWDMGTTWI